jgi:transposase-like protein
MTEQSPAAGVTERVQISCPGCGRNDHVSRPAGQTTNHWKCLNCSKEFDLERGKKH